ncbi:MAG: adenylate/guanylate cyclase domain-containing protein [Verrucomicrobiota bacterium]
MDNNPIDSVLEAPKSLEAPPWRRLVAVFLTMFAAQAIGSLFNIGYNLSHISPLLTAPQREAFERSIQLYNATAYPALVLVWAWCVFSLRKAPRGEKDLGKLRRRVIQLPLIASIVAAIGWIGCIPALFVGLRIADESLNPHIFFHFPVSVLIAMVIAVTIGYFAIDWMRQRLLFRFFFDTTSPSEIDGAIRLTVAGRGHLWTVAASICPIIALLLLLLSPNPKAIDTNFAIAVAAGGILCALIAGALMSRLVIKPIAEMRDAASRIGDGDLDVEVNQLRADEFGVLAKEFNLMVEGLRDRERVVTTFGRHVGEEIAQELLRSEQDLGGVERTLSVLFADIRGFTTRCERLSPTDAVTLLNLYHTHMTAVIERHGGIVTQLIGDGMMALFGATREETAHADEAIAAAREMIRSIPQLNQEIAKQGFEPIKIGVGINTGLAVVGTIGSPRRQEYTAIGDTVNTAARIESMTKDVDGEILIAEATWMLAKSKPPGKKLALLPIRGRDREMTLYLIGIEEG